MRYRLNLMGEERTQIGDANRRARRIVRSHRIYQQSKLTLSTEFGSDVTFCG